MITVRQFSAPVRQRSAYAAFALRCALLLAFAAALTTPASTLAQTGQGSINGRVTDPRGALVAKAEVTVTNVDTNEQQHTHTNGAGTYNVEALNPGTYRVEVAAPGFQSSITDKVTVSTAQAVQVDEKLSIGNENITVTVTSQDSLLSKSSDVSTTVDHELVENLLTRSARRSRPSCLSPASKAIPRSQAASLPKTPATSRAR